VLLTISNVPRNRIVVLLSHYDDELFLLPYLVLNKHDHFHFIYLCAHGKRLRLLERIFDRINEFKKAEKLLKSFTSHSTFQNLGDFLKAEDGHFHEIEVSVITKLLYKVLDGPPIKAVLSLSYEGGHQDHDITWAIAQRLSKMSKSTHMTLSGYRQHPRINRYPLFVVMKHKMGDGEISFPRLQTLKLSIQLILIYRSQLGTWFGLLPGIVTAVLKGKVKFALNEAHTPLPSILYENRKRTKYDLVRNKIQEVQSI
jgi:LmbE family N-acetylglucosaminyl deacetylase